MYLLADLHLPISVTIYTLLFTPLFLLLSITCLGVIAQTAMMCNISLMAASSLIERGVGQAVFFSDQFNI